MNFVKMLLFLSDLIDQQPNCDVIGMYLTAIPVDLRAIQIVY